MSETTAQTKSQTDQNVIGKIRKDLNEKTTYTEGQLSVDIYQNEDNLIILAPISGCDIHDIELTITDDVLSIKGRRALEADIDTDNFFTKECFWGTFSRSIVLPTKTETSKILAKFSNGILRIEIPKVEAERTRKIEIVEVL